MNLFDLIDSLNTEMSESVGRDDFRPLIGRTDGRGVVITFLDIPVWDSSTWTEGKYAMFMSEESKIRAELNLIGDHIKEAIDVHISTIANVEF